MQSGKNRDHDHDRAHNRANAGFLNTAFARLLYIPCIFNADVLSFPAITKQEKTWNGN